MMNSSSLKNAVTFGLGYPENPLEDRYWNSIYAKSVNPHRFSKIVNRNQQESGFSRRVALTVQASVTRISKNRGPNDSTERICIASGA